MSKVEIIISEKSVYKWFNNNSVYVRGYIFDENNNFYENENLLEYFSGCNSPDTFSSKISRTNGLFTVVCITENGFYAASDIIRMFPLFYKKDKLKITISDDISKLTYNCKINDLQKIEILGFGYNLQDGTPYSEIKQIQAGEIIYLENNNLQKFFYYNYLTEKKSKTDKSKTEYFNDCVFNFQTAFKRIIKALNGRTAVVPLSGGYDSRLIATLLKSENYNNVICYTYGKKGIKDISVSEKVAKTLGFKWYYIEYDDELVKNFIQSNDFTYYISYLKQEISFPFFQEIIAVKYLKDNNLIPKDCVFLPGHSGDFLGGSQLYSDYYYKNNFADIIFKRFYFLDKPNEEIRFEIYSKINKLISDVVKNKSNIENYSVIEEWEVKEKLSKFIANSSHEYNFFGYKHMFFYWDKPLISFFRDLPFEYKLYKTLYDEVLKNEFFIKFSLNFETELQPSKFQLNKQRIKNKLKTYLPAFVKRKIRIKNDWLNTELLLNGIIAKYSKEISYIMQTGLKYNSISILWLINQIIVEEKQKSIS